jgi:hypothetical protein
MRTTPASLENVSFVKGVSDFENPENINTLMSDVLMDSAYSILLSELFTKVSHHGNSLFLIIQNLFQQGQSSRDISLNSKHIVVFIP